jgi:CRISPR-associated protein Csm1
MTTSTVHDLRRALCQHVLLHIGQPVRYGSATDLTLFLAVMPSGDGDSGTIFQTLTRPAHSFPFTPKDNLAQTLVALRTGAFGERGSLWQQAQTLPDPADDFDSWAAWVDAAVGDVPGSRGEPGVSLAQEFKILSAISHACAGEPKRLEDGFQLVLGDFPGVQRVIYTITSDGATKGVRGRSFFLQLMAECIARRILGEQQAMPITNALYIAGSKFLLLLPASAQVQKTATDINTQLLDTFEGDLSLVLASTHLPVEGITDHARFASDYQLLLDQEALQKTQPFHDLTQQPKLFEEFGVGSQYYCAISRREPGNENEIREAEKANAEKTNSWISWEQHAFVKLAEDLAKLDKVKGSKAVLVFTAEAPTSDTQLYPTLLHKLTGMACYLSERDSIAKGADSRVIALNRADFNHTGVRFIATRTPLATAEDAAWWNQRYPDEAIDTGDIRNFELLATGGPQEKGFARYGILRMDVDSLGAVFRERLGAATLTRRVALSTNLSRFFEVYVPRILQKVEHELTTDAHDRHNSLYLIYGGGDDLFVVGEWDLLPELAQQIHNLLHEYTSGALTISAGIEIVPARFPFYVAAEMAKESLDDRAKEARPGKNAICLFGEVFYWEAGADWELLRNWKDEFRAQAGNRDQSSLIRNILNIYDQWLNDCKRFGDAKLRFGPFIWRACYQLTRTVADKSAREALIKLVTENPRTAGVAARWADVERRTHERKKEGE